MRLSKAIFAFCCVLSVPALALDLEAVSRGLVESGPWGRHPEMLPYLLAWFGVVLLLAALLKVLHREYDHWRTRQQAFRAAQEETEKWLLELGAMLEVPVPPKLKPGVSLRGWREYRHHLRLALKEQLRHGREAIDELAELRASGKAG